MKIEHSDIDIHICNTSKDLNEYVIGDMFYSDDGKYFLGAVICIEKENGENKRLLLSSGIAIVSKENKKPKCECGANSIGMNSHSDWCSAG